MERDPVVEYVQRDDSDNEFDEVNFSLNYSTNKKICVISTQ